MPTKMYVCYTFMVNQRSLVGKEPKNKTKANFFKPQYYMVGIYRVESLCKMYHHITLYEIRCANVLAGEKKTIFPKVRCLQNI